MNRDRFCRILNVKIIGLACAVLLVLALSAFACREAIGAALFEWTGEEEPVEQIKGLGALVILGLTQPPIDTQPFVPIDHTELNPYGVNTFLEQEVEEAKVRRSLQMIRDAGFGWIRQEFPWEDIEIHGKGDFEDRRRGPAHSSWTKYDRIVELASEYGIGIVARLDHPPAWTRHDGIARGTFAPPDDLNDYGDFVEAVVSRYRGKIRYYQIWNEPNIYPEWGEQPVDPVAYTELLKVGYTRAKRADPDCVVVSAGLAPTLEQGPRNLNDLVFLERMYQAGAQNYFDVLAVMGYGLWTGPTDRRVSADRTNFSRPQLIRQIMVRHGDAYKPIWAMEIGWNAAPPTMLAPYGRVSEEQQARYLVRAYQRVQDDWPWMGVMFTWFFKRADDHERDQPFYYFRLVDPDFTPHPAYAAMKNYATQPPVVPIGYHQEDHWAITYRGDWQAVADPKASLGTYRVSRHPSDSLEFTFRGSDADLVVFASPDAGAIRVTVDGESTRLDLHSAALVPIAHELGDGEHRVELVVERGAVSIDGLIVRRTGGDLRRPLGVLALVVGIAGLGAMLWSRRHAGA